VAEDVAAAPAAGVEPAARPAVERAERERHSAYYSRFTLAYTLLAMVAATAVAVLVVVLARPSGARAQHWSTFVPTGSPVAKARQIATQVSSEYKLPTGRKLVTVVASPLQTTRFLQSTSGQVSVEVPISTLAIEADASTGKHEEGDFTAFDAGSTVAYQMCGFGSSQQDCGIVSGVESASRGQLLRREALELALYTLKHVPGTTAVLTYLPPPASTQAPDTAVLVARKDVARNLDRPLARTLTPTKQVLGGTPGEGAQVDKLTLGRLYTYDYQTLPGDGTAILVLTAAIAKRS
jgi:hypothetical protein